MSGSHRAPDDVGATPGAGRRRAGAKHGLTAAQRREALRAEELIADREGGRAERVPAPTLPPKRPVRRSSGGSGTRTARTPWYRQTRMQVVVGGTALVLAVIARVLAPSGSEDPKPPATAPGAGLNHFGADWVTADKSAYRISVTPLNTFTSHASADGCVPAPRDGFVNARFAVRIENRSKGSAPVPTVDFGANVNADGDPDPTLVHLPEARTNVAVGPAVSGAGCGSASGVGPKGRDELPPGRSLDLVGVVGGVRIPVEQGLSLIVRYVEADPSRAHGSQTTEVLAPFPAFPTGS